MKPQITNDALASFFLWAENKILKDGRAFKNHTSKLYYTEDSRLNGYVSYNSPFKQWVYNKGISGAHICEGISGDISLNNYESGLQIDYENGRILLPSSFGTGLNISGSYSFKDINFYLANETEESVITNEKFYLNSRFDRQPTGGLIPYSYYNPAAYLNILNNYNQPFALGGVRETKINLSVVTNTETMYQLDSSNFLYADMQEKNFPLLSIYEWPLNEFGNIKTGLYPSGYNYNQVIEQKCQPGNLFYVESVKCSKISDKIKINNKLFVGIADIEVCKII